MLNLKTSQGSTVFLRYRKVGRTCTYTVYVLAVLRHRREDYLWTYSHEMEDYRLFRVSSVQECARASYDIAIPPIPALLQAIARGPAWVLEGIPYYN